MVGLGVGFEKRGLVCFLSRCLMAVSIAKLPLALFTPPKATSLAKATTAGTTVTRQVQVACRERASSATIHTSY